ncbi:hypothetical protein GCM10009642_15950 [Nocardiopsis metallicus]
MCRWMLESLPVARTTDDAKLRGEPVCRAKNQPVGFKANVTDPKGEQARWRTQRRGTVGNRLLASASAHRTRAGRTVDDPAARAAGSAEASDERTRTWGQVYYQEVREAGHTFRDG